MMQQLIALLYAQEKALQDRQTPLSFIKLHNGIGFRNPKVSFLVFAEASQPFCFLKTVRYAKDNFVIERAHDRLKRLNKALSNLSAPLFTVPTARWCASVDGVSVAAETIVQGQAVGQPSESQRKDIFQHLLVWGEAMREGETTQEDVLTLAKEMERFLCVSDVSFQKIFDEYFQKVWKGFEQAGVMLPKIPAHGDFTPGNILVLSGGEIGVIDWDRFGDIWMPLFDLFTFCERIVPAGKNLFLECREEIGLHLQKLGLNESVLPLLVFFYVILSEWRKRESVFAWEPQLWNKSVEKMLQLFMSQAKIVWPDHFYFAR